MSEMKEFLIGMFNFNLDANLKMVSAVRELPANDEMLKHLSHLANCQYKWLERITLLPQAAALDWWTPVYTPEELGHRFSDSTTYWVEYLGSLDEHGIEKEIRYTGHNNSAWTANLKDIALQLIFHSFHHRAQVQMMIRAAGHKPAFIDYIGSKAHKKGPN